MNTDGLVFKLLCWILLFHIAQSTLSKSDKKRPKKSDIIEGPGPLSVYDKNLVKINVKWKDIVSNHKSYYQNDTKLFANGMTLGYVTPWNNHGYDIAKIFGNKFTYISPVWLQLKRKDGSFFITGDHDIDKKWIQDIKRKGAESNLRVVPRLLFEGWKKTDFKELVLSSGLQEELIEVIKQFLKKKPLDGLVVEIWNQLPSADLIDPMPNVISKVADDLRQSGFIFILAIPPPMYQGNSPGIFRHKEFSKLVNSVDALSLMTYDYSTFQNPGPNSPIYWMKKCVEHLVPDPESPNRAKILLGMNLYGLDHSITGGSHIFGPSYINVLATYKPQFQYDDSAEEHYFEYKSSDGRHTVFYPTLYSINRRIQLATELGTGLSFWEIGQGQDFFYDLL